MIDAYRCPKCGRKLLYLKGIANIKCPKCKSIVYIDTSKEIVVVKNEKNKRSD